MDLPECEACGLQSAQATYTRVRTTNGGLLLCAECLGDINRKNPVLLKLEKLLRVQAECSPWVGGTAFARECLKILDEKP